MPLKLHFEPDLDYQHDGIEAVCDLFRGQDICRTEFTVTKDALGGAFLPGFESDLGIGNRLKLLDDELFANLQDPPPEVNADWSVSTTQPIPALLADGIYSATANKDSPSLADPFKVQFVRLTDAAPGGQSYELLDAGFNVVGTGQTSQPVPIPEPETWALLALGFAALGLQRSKRRARN